MEEFTGTDKELKEMYKIVCGIMSKPESFAFREPVDWKGLGLLDYPEVVKNPMDLGTVKSKMESNQYTTVEEVATDVRLVWSNCMLYNRDGSEFYHLADKFSRGFEGAYRALRKLSDNSPPDPNRIPSVDEKIQLSHDIFKIGNSELARVLTIIETSAPYALSRKASTDEVLINFDALPAKVFHEVDQFVSGCVLAIAGNNKRGKKRKTDGKDS
eukprot:gene5582-5999_t